MKLNVNIERWQAQWWATNREKIKILKMMHKYLHWKDKTKIIFESTKTRSTNTLRVLDDVQSKKYLPMTTCFF